MGTPELTIISSRNTHCWQASHFQEIKKVRTFTDLGFNRHGDSHPEKLSAFSD